MTKHAVAAMLALSLSANPAFAGSTATAQGVPSEASSSSTDSSDNTTPIYFGNGCFWGRQKDFVDVEKALGREGGKISAITGYAGGSKGAGIACFITLLHACTWFVDSVVCMTSGLFKLHTKLCCVEQLHSTLVLTLPSVVCQNMACCTKRNTGQGAHTAKGRHKADVMVAA